jgi:hypothetical protein
MMFPPAFAAPASPMLFAPTIAVTDRVVALGQLADLSVLPAPLREQVQGLTVLKLRRDRVGMRIPVAALNRRIGGLAPALKPWLPASEGELEVRYAGPSRSTAALAPCVRVAEEVPVDGVPTAKSFLAAPCLGAVSPALWFDRRTGVLRAARALKLGEILQAPARDIVASVAPGQSLLIEATVGPVRVQRRVEAIQPARPGQRLFARTTDGAVLSIPFPEETP